MHIPSEVQISQSFIGDPVVANFSDEYHSRLLDLWQEATYSLDEIPALKHLWPLMLPMATMEQRRAGIGLPAERLARERMVYGWSNEDTISSLETLLEQDYPFSKYELMLLAKRASYRVSNDYQGRYKQNRVMGLLESVIQRTGLQFTREEIQEQPFMDLSVQVRGLLALNQPPEIAGQMFHDAGIRAWSYRERYLLAHSVNILDSRRYSDLLSLLETVLLQYHSMERGNVLIDVGGALKSHPLYEVYRTLALFVELGYDTANQAISSMVHKRHLRPLSLVLETASLGIAINDSLFQQSLPAMMAAA